MQWDSSRIWSRVAVSISYDDNHYTHNSEFKPVKLRLKIDLVSYPARAEGLVNGTITPRVVEDTIDKILARVERERECTYYLATKIEKWQSLDFTPSVHLNTHFACILRSRFYILLSFFLPKIPRQKLWEWHE